MNDGRQYLPTGNVMVLLRERAWGAANGVIEAMHIQRAMWLWAAILALCVVTGAAAAAGAGVYKWTDENGAVHYSDQMPSDSMGKAGGAVLDKQGRAVKKIEPAPTPAQVKAKEAEDERQRALAKVQDDKNRRDRALTLSYTTEDEIDIARHRAVTTIESQIKSSEAYSADLSKRQQVLEKQKTSYGTKAVPVPLESELSGIAEELERQTKLIGLKRQELVAVNARYDTDKQRWRDLKTEQPSRLPGAPAASAAADPIARPVVAPR
jgi:hypothetical protein